MGGRGTGAVQGSAEGGFPDLTREQHFRRHGAEFDAQSAGEYERLARAFAKREGTAGIDSFTSGSDLVFLYENSTNTFLIRKANGELVTFYRPTSLGYWQRQKDLYGPGQ